MLPSVTCVACEVMLLGVLGMGVVGLKAVLLAKGGGSSFFGLHCNRRVLGGVAQAQELFGQDRHEAVVHEGSNCLCVRFLDGQCDSRRVLSLLSYGHDR